MVKKGSTVISDSWSGYHSVKDSYTHEVVQHSLGIYVNKKGFHTNSIGGFRGHLKRMITGVYYVMSPKHLPKYCKESAFRYSTYKISDGEREVTFVSRPDQEGQKTYLYDMDSYQVVKSKKCEIWFRYDFTEADFRDGVPVSND